MRNRLRKQIIEAWTASIETDYQRQRINSERSLQASLWSQLNQRLDARTRRMFIEPAVTLSMKAGTKTLYPDLVICNSKQIIAVIELKYQPRIQPSYHKDVETLRLIAAHRSEINLSNSRYRGTEVDSKAYGLAREAIFVWAGVHREPNCVSGNDSVAILTASTPELRGSFLELHASTRDGLSPSVYSERG